MRLTARWPSIASIVPFIPVVALWWLVTALEVFPRVFLPGPLEVVQAFGSLIYKGILPEYLQDSMVRLAVGAFWGIALGIPLGILVGMSQRAHTALWPLLLFFQAIGDIAWLPILVIWFGYGLTTMTIVIVYTVIFPVVLNTVLGVRSIPINMHRAALSLGAPRLARAVGGGAAGRAAQYRHRPAQRPRLRLAGADRGRDHRRHQRHRLSHVRCAPRRLGGGDPARHDHPGYSLVHRGQLDPGAHRARHRTALGVGDAVKSLIIRNLSKTYFDLYAGTNVTAVHDVSLEVQQGEFVSIVGPSGCGKTTILNMIAGFIPITGGEILIDGRPVKGPGPDRGVVFQSFALFPWRTVLENVAFGPKMRGVGKAEREKIAHDYLALAKLSEAAGRYPNELSGGMQQRVGVVRALANEPDVLLMDEPFASVDAQTRMTLQEELTRIWQEKRPTVIFITHDVGEAVFLANRVVALSKGRVLEEIAVDLPRPRSWDALNEDAQFKALTSRVLQLVRSA